MGSGAVFRPPGRAARGLVIWAVDLWPYVNGKALVNGIDLKEMDVSDMLDVLHYFFEEDTKTVSTEEQSKAIDSMRTQLYRLYGQTYRYGSGSSSATNSGRSYVSDGNDFPTDIPFDPSAQEVKPYVPATDFNPESSMPFGSALDAPLG